MQTRHKGFRFAIALSVLLLLSSCLPIQPPTPVAVADPPPSPPTRILLIGDAFLTSGSASLDAFLKGMARGGDPPLTLETSSVYLWGSLQEHWDDGDALAAIQTGAWDVVVLEQDLAMSAGNVQYYERAVTSYQEAVRLLHAAIAESGAQTVLVASAEHRFPGKKNVDDFYAVTAALGDELGVNVAPVGFAFARAKDADPNLAFYGSEEATNTVAGVYLTAAVLYATLYDRTPAGITWLPTDDVADDPKLDDLRRALTIAPETRDLLLRIAWEVVEATGH